MAEATKNCDIEWCKEIPASWDYKPNKYVMRKIKDVCTRYSGEDILSLTMQGVIIRDLNAGGKMPTTFDGYQKVYAGNLLMCLFDYDVTPRCIGLIKNNGLTSPAYSQFVLNDGYSARYYYYYYLMIDHTKELLHLAKNLRHSFTEDQIGALNVPVPPIDEQGRIADFLDEKCAEIDKLSKSIQKQINILNDYKKSVITRVVTKGLNPKTKMKDSGINWIGEIPQDWTCKKIKYLADIKQNNSFVDGDWIEAPFVKDNGIRYITTGNIGDGIFKRQGDGYVSEEDFKMLRCKYAYPGDLIFSRLNEEYGRSCILPNDYPKYVIAVDNVILRTEHDKRFICYCTQCPGYHDSVADYARGTAMKRVSRVNLGNISIPIPTPAEEIEIANYLDDKCSRINESISIKQEQIAKLDAYKKSIIYEYVTGKKRVA